MLSVLYLMREKWEMTLPSFDCVLCADTCEETMEHLFLHCTFASACWNRLGLNVPHQADAFEAIDSFKLQLNTSLFMHIVILMCWGIWISWNDLIFHGLQPSLQATVKWSSRRNSCCFCTESKLSTSLY